MNRYAIGAGALLVSAGFFAGGLVLGRVQVQPEIVDAAPISEETTALDDMFHDYLMRHPEVVSEAQDLHTANLKAAAEQAAKAAIGEYHDQLMADPALPVLGNPDGTKVIAEFFDYNCGYCRRSSEDVAKLIENDPNLKVVLHPFPILGPDSTAAHIVAAAFFKLMPEKYPEFHEALLSGSGKADEATATREAIKLGADEDVLKKAVADLDVNATFASSFQLANALNITGTPSYIIGDELVFGAIGYDGMQSYLDAQDTGAIQ